MRKIYNLPPPEAKYLFTYLQRLGVRTDLDAYSQEKAIDATHSLFKQVSDWRQPTIIGSIAFTILTELRKSKEINEEIIRNVVQFYPKLPGAEEEEEEDEIEKFAAALGSKAEEEEETEQEPEVEDLPDPECDDFDFDLVGDCMDRAKEAEPTEQDRKELLKQCSEMGCRLKHGHEQKILDLMIPFLSSNFTRFSFDRTICIETFMEHVQDYINRSCILNDLGTVNRAIQTVKKLMQVEEDWKKEQHQSVSRMLKKDIVSTIEEGIATPMCLLKQEEKKNVEIRNLTNPKKENMWNVNFCLTQPESEGMETEECERVTRWGAKRD